MELVGAYSDRDLALGLAQEFKGRILLDPRPDTSHLPFAALVCLDSDRADAVLSADVGVYLCYRRTQKAHPERLAQSDGSMPGKIALFPMVRSESLSREDADAHWRDIHTPIALRVHQAMTFYTQLAIVQTIKGRVWDGIALCGFDTEEDLRTKFYATKEGQKEVENDVRTFANPKASPRRLICDEYVFE